MSVINTNITSVIAQKNLTSSKSALTTAMERLSSGLRINSAKDDAAGQAISNRMTAQVRGLAQAQRNANDGISVAQTAEGALNQINDNLQRVRELAVQAQNSTNSPDDLGSIQNEIGQRLAEINRVSEETSFNGVKVLAEDQQLTIQVGANDGQTIKINLGKINAESLGLANFNVDGKAEIANKAATEDDLKLAKNITTAPGTPPTYTLNQANTKISANDILSKASSVTTTANATDLGYGSGTLGALTKSGNNYTYDVTAVTATNAQNDIKALVMGTAEGPTKATFTNATGGASQEILIDSAGNITNTDGVALYLTTNNELTVNQGDAGTVLATADVLTEAIGAGTTAAGDLQLAIEGGPTIKSTTAAGTADIIGASISSSALATLSKDQTFDVTATIAAGDSATGAPINVTLTNGVPTDTYTNAAGKLTTAATTDTALTVHSNGKVTDSAANQYFVGQDGNITSAATTAGTKTEDPLATLDDALKMVDSLRSDLGAVQNRFESAITNLSTNETNLTAARSRIQDADYAVEVGNMTRAQILQQAGTSVLAQANQLPQGVLSLLR
ncbi:Flagellin [Pseudomonas sp. OF001]|uniref:flagellin N-terminal helical domain-containing protein n=1 Tax=Pseudomonas sp. OF001 TaxID=2772300 RepID=UPI00191975C6|nr:flagellin [Pseudomonas sp. OF001]CAD5379286.1 Flagellin [Pseudomonas sp. OF001]